MGVDYLICIDCSQTFPDTDYCRCKRCGNVFCDHCWADNKLIKGCLYCRTTHVDHKFTKDEIIDFLVKKSKYNSYSDVLDDMRIELRDPDESDSE